MPSPSTASPRFTGDLDIFIKPDSGHVERALNAVRKLGFPVGEVRPGYLLERRKILQLGRIPVQVHIMTTITGIAWDDVWKSREAGIYGDVPVYFIGREALITNKRATGRSKDVADVEALIRRPKADG